MGAARSRSGLKMCQPVADQDSPNLLLEVISLFTAGRGTRQ